MPYVHVPNRALAEMLFHIERRKPFMTINGTINKTLLTLFITIFTAIFTWSLMLEMSALLLITFGGAIGGLLIVIIIIHKKELAPIFTPVYGGLEGFALGGISAFFEFLYPSIVIQAVLLTFGILLALLLAYKSRLIKPSPNFVRGVIAAICGIAFIYFLTLVLSFVGIAIPYIHEGGPIGIAFSIFVIGIASFTIVLDFHFIEKNVKRKFPKYMEWYAALGLMVSLIWLYLEVLILLTKLRRRE